MKIIKFQESYSSKMLRELLPKAWFFLISLCILLILIFLPIFFVWLRTYWLGIIIGSLIVFLIIRNLDFIFDEIRNFRYGKEGEEEAKKILNETLDDNYIYVENYIIPNTRIGDIDGLLIGPKGIIVLEVKNYAGVFRISGGDMLRKLRGDIYKLYRRSPFQQVMRQAKYLDKFFKDSGVNVRVLPIVVLVTGKISAISGATGVFVTEINKLTNHIFQLNSIQNYSVEFSQKILQALGVKEKND